MTGCSRQWISESKPKIEKQMRTRKYKEFRILSVDLKQGSAGRQVPDHRAISLRGHVCILERSCDYVTNKLGESKLLKEENC